MGAGHASKQELLSRRAKYMTLVACQGRMNVRYGKAFGPLELSSIRRIKEQAWGYPDLHNCVLSGYLDAVTRRDKLGDSRRRYSKKVPAKRRCTSRI